MNALPLYRFWMYSETAMRSDADMYSGKFFGIFVKSTFFEYLPFTIHQRYVFFFNCELLYLNGRTVIM